MKMQSSTQACTEDATAAVSRNDGEKEERGASLAGKFLMSGKAFYVAYPVKQFSSFCEKYQFQGLPSSVSTSLRVLLDELSMRC